VTREEKIHKTIHHTYEELELKIDNPELTNKDRQKFKDLVNEYVNVFALSNMELEGTDIIEYDIHVKQDARPSRQKPYNYSEKARAEIKKKVQELLAIKFIRRSTSAWCSIVLLVKKTDNSMRMVVEYRQLTSLFPIGTYETMATSRVETNRHL